MTTGVGLIQAVGQHGDGGATHGECPTVGCGVDAGGQATDDGQPRGGCDGAKVMGIGNALRAGPTTADDGQAGLGQGIQLAQVEEALKRRADVSEPADGMFVEEVLEGAVVCHVASTQKAGRSRLWGDQPF